VSLSGSELSTDLDSLIRSSVRDRVGGNA